MNETIRTMAYAGAAAVALVIAYFAAPSSQMQPSELTLANVGKEFYPEFKDPNAPTTMRVVTFDEKQAAVKPFVVDFKDGLWTIPSHHDYPADGADRLAKTAASAIGIRRDELRSSSDADHEELGVIDPQSTDMTRLKGYGQRITLTKGSGDVLVDLIIGKQVKDRPGYYFVRRPDEKSTYVAKVDIDLSTRFADWVETDLLKLDSGDLAEIDINDYSIDEARGRILQGEISVLEKANGASQWTLKGLDEAKDELDSTKVTALVSALDDLKLVGVRPKPKGLSDDLKMDEGIRLDPLTRIDLQSKGFVISQGQLLSNEGELIAATNKGVEYVLRFGEVFTGDEEEIEVGIEADKKKEKNEQKKVEDKDEKKDDAHSSRYVFVMASFNEKYLGPKPQKPKKPAAAAKPAAAKPAAAKKDESKPDDAAKPAGDEDKPAAKPAAETSPDNKKPADEPSKSDKPDADQSDDKKPEADADKPDEGKTADDQEQEAGFGEDQVQAADAEGEPPAEKGKDADPANDKPEPDAAKPEAKPEGKPEAKTDDKPEEKPESKPEEKPEAKPEAKPEVKPAAKPAEPEKSAADLEKEYQAALQKYESDLKAYNAKVTAGKELATKLNRRFADWYYVISADSFAKMHLARKDLIKPKAKAADAAPSDAAPQADAPAIPEAKPADAPADKPAAKPAPADAADKPSSKPEPAADDKPADKPREKTDAPKTEKKDAEPAEPVKDDAPKPKSEPRSKPESDPKPGEE